MTRGESGFGCRSDGPEVQNPAFPGAAASSERGRGQFTRNHMTRSAPPQRFRDGGFSIGSLPGRAGRQEVKKSSGKRFGRRQQRTPGSSWGRQGPGRPLCSSENKQSRSGGGGGLSTPPPPPTCPVLVPRLSGSRCPGCT